MTDERSQWINSICRPQLRRLIERTARKHRSCWTKDHTDTETCVATCRRNSSESTSTAHLVSPAISVTKQHQMQ